MRTLTPYLRSTEYIRYDRMTNIQIDMKIYEQILCYSIIYLLKANKVTPSPTADLFHKIRQRIADSVPLIFLLNNNHGKIGCFGKHIVTIKRRIAKEFSLFLGGNDTGV